ncbi:GcrA cell cycle regulator [Acetobacter tropicalis]|uniref:GcrA cell cycle regulator n=1 Tax=Acetobacter tropicalis TaxID=104102 RepID=A0A094YMI2_9PROT|nr:GcrA family cell cycle regulator [Acetobacter tropicalis]KAA8390721.1 GcrA cell cycle regulator [Acetobacter tropicalis]KAA8393214.1 GcrA cell cycle regulator [Acetobacter tropicalis]KGB22582.1 hypothetical protein AtDm6_2163 [Acetobacter tropicalis]KXV57865.1 GcrA cell cycle regulator [Acetobacter tropicalis]MBC9007295.1 GcrA cell cycle regulator [Acetobacter tropicalis]
MEWTEETISRLKELWAEGLSTAEIGRRLSITKNAVVGKAHRLGLPPRPSPIRRGVKKPEAESVAKPDGATAAAPATSPAPTTKVEAPDTVTESTQVVPKPAPAATPAPTPVAAAPAAAVQPKVAKVEKPAPRAPAKPKPVPQRISDPDPQKRRGPSCCWPIGDPGTPGFHFCGAVPLPGKPYCAEHAQIAYVKLRDRRDNVA